MSSLRTIFRRFVIGLCPSLSALSLMGCAGDGQNSVDEQAGAVGAEGDGEAPRAFESACPLGRDVVKLAEKRPGMTEMAEYRVRTCLPNAGAAAPTFALRVTYLGEEIAVYSDRAYLDLSTEAVEKALRAKTTRLPTRTELDHVFLNVVTTIERVKAGKLKRPTAERSVQALLKMDN